MSGYCKDCVKEFGVESVRGAVFFPPAHHRPRPAPHPGPRCATHWRQVKKQRKGTQHDRYLERTYSMTGDEYRELVAFQGGVCYICRRANGATRKLSVDHDHACCPETPTCGKCTRGAVCRPCNDLLGHLRDDVDAAMRVAAYLLAPPMRQLREKRNGNV